LKYFGFLGRYLSCHQYTCIHIRRKDNDNTSEK